MQAMVDVDGAQRQIKPSAQFNTSMQKNMGIATTAIGDPEPLRPRRLRQRGRQQQPQSISGKSGVRQGGQCEVAAMDVARYRLPTAAPQLLK